MRDIKFKFVLQEEITGRKILSQPYSLEKILGGHSHEMIVEDMEREHGCDGNCTNESVNHCECSPVLDDFLFVDKLQYTGLKDKNGTEVYEGDIVNVLYNYIGRKEVKWDTKGMWNISAYAINKTKIIGSIHENPELSITE